MVRALLISLLVCAVANANDIYVTQAEVNTEETKVALETKQSTTGSTYQQPQSGNTFEKSLIVPTNSAQYCSVVAGCYVQE